MKVAERTYGLAILLPFLLGCGTPGVPRPPSLNLAKPVSDLKAVRSGNQVNLTWTVPTETTDGATFRHRGVTKVCRAINQSLVHQCVELMSFETPATQKTVDASDAVAENRAPSDYATYAIEVENDRGKSAGLSNQAQIPTAAASTLNGNPVSQLTPDAVIVTANVTPLNAAVQQILELRRREKENAVQQESTVAHRLLELPSGEAANLELRDESFLWDKTYEYRVVIAGSAKVPNGNTVMFDAATSAPIEVVAHDAFPPAVPTGVQAVFSGDLGGQQPAIDLTWNPNSDRDLAGYFIYRRRLDEAVSAASKLNPQPVASPSYRDAAVQSGITYSYSISAVDQRGNESKHSEEASEQVPK